MQTLRKRLETRWMKFRQWFFYLRNLREEIQNLRIYSATHHNEIENLKRAWRSLAKSMHGELSEEALKLAEKELLDTGPGGHSYKMSQRRG